MKRLAFAITGLLTAALLAPLLAAVQAPDGPPQLEADWLLQAR